MIYSYEKQRTGCGLAGAARTDGGLSESAIEDLIADNPELLFSDPQHVLLIGRQRAGSRHPDLVFLDGAQNVYVVEIKRGAADRACIGQVQEYAAQISAWGLEHFAEGWKRTGQKTSLQRAYFGTFGFGMATPVARRIRPVVVARGLRPGVAEMLEWLRANGTPISFVPFEFYKFPGRRVIEVARIDAFRARRPSAEDWYLNTNDTYRPGSYLEMFRRNIAVIAGYGAERGMELLSAPKAGDRVFAYLNGHGYIGVGLFGGDQPQPPRTPLWKGVSNELHRGVNWYVRAGKLADAVTARAVRREGYKCPGRGSTLMRISDSAAGDEIEARLKKGGGVW